MNLEKAIRAKFRFPSPAGELTLEQLWDIPLQSARAGKVANLDDTAKEVNRQLRLQAEESFVQTTTNKAKVELEEKLAVLVHVIQVRQAENAAAAAALERKNQKAKLLEILEDRTNQDLLKLSPEELRAKIEAL